jgi:hypothetical protein
LADSESTPAEVGLELEDKFKAVPAALKTALLAAEVTASCWAAWAWAAWAAWAMVGVKWVGKLRVVGDGLRLKAAASEAG